MIRGLFAGTGKSYICQRMLHRNYKVVFICSTQKRLQQFEGEAMTINKFFGISFGHAKPKLFDFSDFDVKVFHEIYFSNLSVYRRIKQFVEQNKQDKLIIARGDCKQLRCIHPTTNAQDWETYVDGVTDKIFPYGILLKECKRLKPQENRDKLYNIKHDIFVNKMSDDESVKQDGFQYADGKTSLT